MSGANKATDRISLGENEEEWNGLEALNSAQLKLLIEQAEKALEVVHAREVQDAMDAMVELARSRGFELKELMGQADFAKILGVSTATASQKSGEPVRFRHKKNPSLTWTGRGRLPRWLKEIKEDGGDIEEHRIAH